MGILTLNDVYCVVTLGEILADTEEAKEKYIIESLVAAFLNMLVMPVLNKIRSQVHNHL